MFNINEVKKFISCGIQTNQIEEQNVFDNRLIYSLNKNNSVKLNSPRYLYKVKNYKLIKKTNFNREYNIKRNNKFEDIFFDNFTKTTGKKIKQKKLIIPKIVKKENKFPKNNSFIRKTHFQRYKNTIVNNNDNQIINQKNKSIKPLEKFSTKNNGIFINISLKNNLSIINDLNKERIFKGNNHIRIMKKNKSYSYKKSIFSRNNNHRRN